MLPAPPSLTPPSPCRVILALATRGTLWDTGTYF